jgi:hypothetical protein
MTEEVVMVMIVRTHFDEATRRDFPEIYGDYGLNAFNDTESELRRYWHQKGDSMTVKKRRVKMRRKRLRREQKRMVRESF